MNRPGVSAAERESVRLLRYNIAVKCAACGRLRRNLKTMLCDFLSVDVGGSKLEAELIPRDGGGQSFAPRRDGEAFPALSPVCEDHQLSPDWR